MRGGLQSWEFKAVYEASNGDLLTDFYVPALNRATKYDRAAGYFRSSIYDLIAVAVSEFALDGGRMRLICSPSLLREDEEEIRRVGVTASMVERGLDAEIEAALRSPVETPNVELLGSLLMCGALDIKIAYKADERGIFHSKVGVLSDGTDRVSFEGSANETRAAWESNEERFKAFRSWLPEQEQLVAFDEKYFDSLWAGERGTLVVEPLPDVTRETLERHGLPDPQEAVERHRRSRRVARRAVVERRQLMEHQVLVRQSWWDSRRGIIDHVTGGGKTVTALRIIRDWYERTPNAAVVVVVPTSILLSQWRQEIERELGDLDLRVLAVGGEIGTPHWRDFLNDYTTRSRGGNRRLVLATLASASSDDFVARARVGEHTLVVADEVHSTGARRARGLTALSAGGRLGLSATPERFGDPEGTAVIFDYFGEKLEPTFTIRDAQSSDPPRLVPYNYRFSLLHLDHGEYEEYQRLTKQVGALAGRAGDPGGQDVAERLRLKLIERARVLKKASGKIGHAIQLIGDQYEAGDRWLIYCEDTDQLEQLIAELQAVGVAPMRYTSAMNFSKGDTIRRFEAEGGVLVSMKCLDEGVDIPNVTHALILASSLNPREHLQRRGRVLRAADGKNQAELFDVIVGPEADRPDAVFASELSRARAFAVDAANRRNAEWRMRALTVDGDDMPDAGAIEAENIDWDESGDST